MRVATIGRIGRALMVCGLLAVIVSAGAQNVHGRRGPAAGDRRELVVLVHGMGRSRMSMWLMERELEKRGYRVMNWGYSSTADSIPALAAALARDVAAEEGAAPRVHFVGHSLGNILIRWTLSNRPPRHAGREVMLAPPNQGSRTADRYARWMGWLMPPIRELGTARGSTARTVPVPRGVEIGVIAGADDGKVSVEETHLEGEREHVVVPAAHTFLMNRDDVQRLVLRFLQTGTFGRGLARPAHADRQPLRRAA